jgi:hypothetical protein
MNYHCNWISNYLSYLFKYATTKNLKNDTDPITVITIIIIIIIDLFFYYFFV